MENPRIKIHKLQKPGRLYPQAACFAFTFPPLKFPRHADESNKDRYDPKLELLKWQTKKNHQEWLEKQKQENQEAAGDTVGNGAGAGQESKPEQKEDDPWQARAQSNAAGVYKDALVLLWQKMPQDATAEQRQHAKGVLLSLLDMATGSGALGLQMDDRFSDNRLEEMVDIAMGPNKPPDASMFIAGVTTRVAEMGLDLLEGAMRYFNGTVVRPLTGFRYYKAEARFASKVNQAIAALPERAVKGELSNDFQKLFDVTQQNLDQADTPYAFGKALVDFLVLASSLVTGPELFAAQLTARLARLRKAVEKAAGAGGGKEAALAEAELAKTEAGKNRVAPQKRDSNVVVLGNHPDYVKMSDTLNARRFDIPMEIWGKMTPAEQWAANVKFLDRAVAHGNQLTLATNFYKAKKGSYYLKEVDYLIGKGYTLSQDGWNLIPPGSMGKR